MGEEPEAEKKILHNGIGNIAIKLKGFLVCIHDSNVSGMFSMIMSQNIKHEAKVYIASV